MEFDSFPKHEPVFVQVQSLPGLGKTHLACTFPDPYFLDTENRAWMVMEKFNNYSWKKVSTFEDYQQAIYGLIEEYDPGTIVVDSASYFQEVAATYWLDERNKKHPNKIMETVYPPENYKHVYRHMNNLIETIRNAEWNLVFSIMLKDEYEKVVIQGNVESAKTGRLEPQGYKRMPYRIDLHLQIDRGFTYKNKTYLPNTPIVTVLKNAYVDPMFSIPYIYVNDYKYMMSVVKTEFRDDYVEYLKDYLQTKPKKTARDVLILNELMRKK